MTLNIFIQISPELVAKQSVRTAGMIMPKTGCLTNIPHITAANFLSVVRARFYVMTQHYQDKDSKTVQAAIGYAIKKALPKNFEPVDLPIEVKRLRFAFKPIDSLSAKDRNRILVHGFIPKTTKPDLPDNLSKMLFDAMQGLVYVNDSRVWRMCETEKVYAEQEGITIELFIDDAKDGEQCSFL